MDEMALPLKEAPTPPAESPTDLAEMANQLYEAATKLQRDAEALMKAAREEAGEKAPVKTPEEKMSPEETEAASNAILGI